VTTDEQNEFELLQARVSALEETVGLPIPGRTIRRRFRLILLAFVIFTVTACVSAFIDVHQGSNLKKTQDAFKRVTVELAIAIANGQTYLCNQIAALYGESGTPHNINCFSRQQRYQQIISRLQTQK